MSAPVQQGSYIDLKNCTILIHDGFNQAAAVNLMAGYMIGASTIVIDGLPALTILPIGAQVLFTGDTTLYYIASTIETAGLTTSIVLDKPLVAALVDNQVLAVGPNTLEIKVGEGNLSYSETKNREYKLNRGRIDKVRNGDEAPVEMTTTFAWTHIKAHSSETIPSVEDVLKRRGVAANWVSTGQGCDPYAVNIMIINSPTACVGETYPVEKVLFPEYRYEKLDHDAKAGTVNMSGKCNATEPTITRSAT